MKTTWMLASLLCLLPVGAAVADRYDAIRETAEASMLVTSVIDIDAAGQVTRFKLNDRGLIPADVVALVEQAVPQWRFEPLAVDGKPVSTSSKATLRLLLRGEGGKNYVSIVAANLTELGAADDAEQNADVRSMAPPRYPASAGRLGITGTVYVAFGVDANGNTRDIFVEQVNLTVLARSTAMEQGRESLAAAVVAAARRWTFNPSLAAKSPGQRTVARVPVVFFLDPRMLPKPYTWEAYIPGPRTAPPWLDATKPGNRGNDAIVPGELYIAGTAPTLLTPLDAG